jgi:hypothetical protein
VTAAQGRCAGCGERGAVKAVDWHISQCSRWAELYRKDPAAVLDAAQEYVRWAAEDRDREHAADLQARTDDTVARRQESEQRFQLPDLLGE